MVEFYPKRQRLLPGQALVLAEAFTRYRVIKQFGRISGDG
jgi:hypothetical protein